MNTKRRVLIYLRLAMGIVATLAALAVLTFFLLRGRGLGLWRIAHIGQAVLDSPYVSSHSHGGFTNVIFLHHSTGRYLINQGHVRQELTKAEYSFWDHDYNWEGLIRPDGTRSGYSYNVPGDNTDPDGLAAIFAQPEYSLPLNTLSGLLQHEVIAFKSCFPVSNITSDDQLEEYQSYYLAIRDVMDAHPEKLFVVVTPPPLNPAQTDGEAAARARAFADWLQSDEYLNGHPNVATFDFFGHLAEDDPTSPEHGMLRAAYREGTDSHPNRLANETVGPLFAGFIIRVAESYHAP